MIVVRVLRDGHALREVVLRQLPATLGRSLDVDLPLSDRTVSRRHAQLELDAAGQAWLVDLGSQNGLEVQGARVERLSLAATVRCRLGNVELEFEPFDSAPTLALQRSRTGPGGAALHPLLALALGLLAVATETVLDASFWSPTQDSRAVLASTALLSMALVLPLLATGLFMVLKVLGRQLRWGHALQAIALLLWIAPLRWIVLLGAYYLVSARAYQLLDETFMLAASVLAVVVVVGVRRPPPHLRFRLAWGLGTLLVVFAIRSIAALSAQRQGEPALDFAVQAPLGGWPGVAQPLEQYEARVRATAEEARRAAELVRVTQQHE